jgi:hypothetical protein
MVDRPRWWVLGEHVLVNLLLAVVVVGGGWWLGIYASELVGGVPRASNEFSGLKEFVAFIAPAIAIGVLLQQAVFFAVVDRIPISARRLAAVISCCLIPATWLALSRGQIGLFGTWLGFGTLTIVLLVYGLVMRY